MDGSLLLSNPVCTYTSVVCADRPACWRPRTSPSTRAINSYVAFRAATLALLSPSPVFPPQRIRCGALPACRCVSGSPGPGRVWGGCPLPFSRVRPKDQSVTPGRTPWRTGGHFADPESGKEEAGQLVVHHDGIETTRAQRLPSQGVPSSSHAALFIKLRVQSTKFFRFSLVISF